ncbi:MAG: carboxypeptidase regulatory-like domain-containing protein, partial [Acidobacteria bacterium]|nr:carboxypeptidase regulatory-like domain-containing protein [Acidobacteriota bacterium]
HSAYAQVRTTGQIVGTVRDQTGAVVPGVELILVDTGTATTYDAKSSADGGFVFPNLQPGTYSLTASKTGFNPVTIQSLVVQTSRSTDVVVQFQVAGVTEVVQVEGRAPVVETSSTTVANTVRNEEIARLPLSGRNILSFALLVPGTATSAGARDSEYNGLPGGAIAITLDGINNNSQRFRSGGTSFFVFAPIRLGAIEEVTVSTAGLSADAGAEGAVQIQFTTRRGSNDFRGQIFDTIVNEGLNARPAVNKARGVPKTRLRQHEYGANFGGPVVRNKLFFFGNFEQLYSPGERTLNRNVLTPEAQQGVFRYTATDNTVRTVNLLEIAGANGFPRAIDPYIAEQFRNVNGALDGGTLTPTTNLRFNTFSFIDELSPNANIYPTGRVDYQATSGLAIRGVLNLHWRDLPTNERFPGLPSVSDGFTSTYYILSTGADWTVRNNLFNQISFGGQSNFEEFRPGNTLAIYESQRLQQGLFRIAFPNIGGVTPDSPQITADQMPIPRNNPVWNFSDTVTWLKGNHTWTFGGTFRRTTMYESIGGAPLTVNLGVATGDPVSSIFNATTIPGVRSTDLTAALQLYALLTGRISGVSGNFALDENTKKYGLNPAFRREAQNVGGLYAQDQWRMTPQLTLNYGLRWELTGAATNPNEVYSSAPPEHLLGPSTAPFQPGVLNGVANPQVFLLPKPYSRDWMNPAPNAGVAWSPDQPDGWLGRLLGKGVYRANFGVNYYDEGLINFQTAAGNGPGLLQSNTLTPGMPGFPPGGLTLRSTFPAFSVFPTEFAFPIDQSLFTFTRGFNGVDPDIRTPYVLNWTVGYQRELWRDAAIEVRYVGNRGHNLWRGYNLNEVNIFENGFLEEFRNAQRNLEINLANRRTGFANNGLPGQVPLPIFDAAFGARGSQGALPAGSAYTNGAFITQLQQGQAGRVANSLAGNSIYLCRMVGNALPGCSRLGFNAPGVYAINVFQPNPFAAGSAVSLLTDDASSKDDTLQRQFRQRYRSGLSLTANYTSGHARTDRFVVGASNFSSFRTLRDRVLDWGPTAYDLRHTFLSYWTHELPFGRQRRFSIDNAVVDQILGGWSVSGIVRIQTGRPFLLTSGRWTVNQNDAGVVLN